MRKWSVQAFDSIKKKYAAQKTIEKGNILYFHRIVIYGSINMRKSDI